MSLIIDKETLHKYDVAGPRYTSYPTAPEWDKILDVEIYKEKLRVFGLTNKTLSLYVHIPFCEQMCYFCACNKVIRPQDKRVGDEFLRYVFKELDMVSALIGRRKVIRQLHWGGGTPSYLSESQIELLFLKISSLFDIDLNGEVAIEIDPRTVTKEKMTLLRRLGFNRVSMGVQDFDSKVQDDINRIQPFEQVAYLNQICRDLNFQSINFDLIYGLPYQTRETFKNTVDRVIQLNPDRIALYSFAYVPWLSKPQNKFNLDAIAKHDEKLDIFIDARENLFNNGYEAIAMDHFARSTDEMAKAFHQGKLHRNFMGYTVKPADEYIGVGPSAIGFIGNTYIQNAKVLPNYYQLLSVDILPIERGKVLSKDDMIRQGIINSLMCHFKVDKIKFNQQWHVPFDTYFSAERKSLDECLKDELITETDDYIFVTDLGKIFIRNVCMGFDRYLKAKDGHKTFSRTI